MRAGAPILANLPCFLTLTPASQASSPDLIALVSGLLCDKLAAEVQKYKLTDT